MPAKKPIVIVVHGMGKHPKGSFKKEFIDAANTALQRYSAYKTKKIENLVNIKEINYDSFFEEIRQKMTDNAKPVATRLKEINMLNGLTWGPELVLKLTSMEARFGEDKFIYTHLLDVVFYASLLGAKVRVDVAKQVADIISKNVGTPIHIVAHSLGTAVIHDTLALLYRKEFDAFDDIPDLDVVTHKLNSIWMVANVSRLVNSVTALTDTYASAVKPTPTGCTHHLANVRHELDPFTWLAQFDPQNDGSWIPKEYYDVAYELIETSVITKLNTHDFGEYIRNPKVAVPLFEAIIDFFVENPDELKQVQKEYLDTDIAGAFDALKEDFDELSITDTASLKSLANTAKTFSETIPKLQFQLDNL